MPKHKFGALYSQKGFDAARDEQRKAPSPSLGAYRTVEFVPEERLVVERNPHYRGLPGNFARIEVKRYKDRQQLIDAFEKGEIDFIVPNAITPEQAADLGKRRPEAVFIRPSSLVLLLQPDLSVPVLARRDTRKGLLAAIDRERIRREVYGDAGRIAHVPIPGDLPKGAVTTTYDPEAAKRLLEASAAVLSGLVLSHNKSPVDTKVAQIIQENLAAAGVTITLKPLDSVFPLYKAGKHGGFVLYAVSGTRSGPAERFWNIPIEEGQYVETTRNDAYDDSVAAIATRERRALYPERRESLRDALYVEFAQRLPLLPLVFAAERIVADPLLRGWQREPVRGFGEGIDGWYFEQGK